MREIDFEFLEKLKINAPDPEMHKIIKKHWDGISKPIDGLGDFEDLICRIGAIQNNEIPDATKRAVVILCADNGIVKEGVSQSSCDVTLSVAKALGKGISTVCVLAKSANADVIAADIGIDSPKEIKGVKNIKVRRGTEDFLEKEAMSEKEALLAIQRGMELVKELRDEGYRIIATGEMGIGNTTTSAAVLSALLKTDPESVTGRGAGLDDAGFNRKKQVIKKALLKYDFDRFGDERKRAFEILRTLGGLDIAGLTGMFIEGAILGIPVVADGLISAVAALLAERIVPGCGAFCIASHRGREKGTCLALESLGLRPYLEGNMALGEGTGAVMLFPLLDMVLDFYKNASTFKEYGLDEYKRYV